MLEATVIFPPTIPIGPVVSPGAAPSKDSSVPALQPTRRTIVTATTKAKTSTAGRWLLDRLVTVNYPPVFCPLSNPAAVERVTAAGPGELAGYDISLRGVLSLGAPLQKDNIVTHRHLVKHSGRCRIRRPMLRCRVTGKPKGGRATWQNSTTDSHSTYAAPYGPGARTR